jgi:hypothetical protein
MANSYPGSGTVILDDLKVCTNIRLQPQFVSYGEHMFMNLESAHSNSYLPVVTFSRAGCTLGAIGLDRASNSDSLGNYAESEMVIGTRANTPTSIQSGGVRRLLISTNGRVGVGVSPGSDFHIKGPSAGGCPFGAELRLWENSFGAVMQGSTLGSTYAFFGNFRYNFATPSSSDALYSSSAGGLLFKDGVHMFTSNPGASTFTPSERLTIDNSGNVGINCTSPGSKLTVGGTLTTTDTITTTSGTVNTIISWNASVGIIGTDTNHGLQIRTCGTERIRITCNGEIGINTTSPGSYKLYVNGAFYSAGSSCEYKTQICQYNTDSCMFMKLTPVTYQYKDEWSYLGKELKSGTQIGLIAEDVADFYPELAMMKEDFDGEKRVRNVDYEKLSIILLSELQKLRAEVDELKTK